MVAPSLLQVQPEDMENAMKKLSVRNNSTVSLQDSFRRSISVPTDHRLAEEDRRFVRCINHLRESLDETSTNLHSTYEDDSWGWFEDIDDVHIHSPKSNSILSQHNTQPTTNMETSLYSYEIEPTRQVWKSFPPLMDLLYEPSYASAGYPWLACLSPSRPMAARIQIRSFRIVEGADGYDLHAEYCIQCWVGDAYRTVWKRFAAFKRFAYTLKSNGSRRTLRAWGDVLDRSSWFRSLDVSYLHQMCCLLETFSQVLLLEAQTPYLLARFIDAE